MGQIPLTCASSDGCRCSVCHNNEFEMEPHALKEVLFFEEPSMVNRNAQPPVTWEPDLSRRHLVLNMDVNKTVIMSDKVGGKTSDMVVNETLANASWGLEEAEKWVLKVMEPSVARPQSEGVPYISYAEWVDKRFPGVEHKKQRTKLNTSFCNPGQPGELLKDHAKRLRDALRLPDGSDVRMLPAFFELLLFLKRENRSFCVVFRTFGEDLEEVASEITEFCEGRHPQFPGARMDGSDGEPDYRLQVNDIGHFGTYHRDAEGDPSIIMGTSEQPGEGKYKDVKDKTLAFYTDFPNVEITSGFFAVQDFVRRATKQCGTYGFRDYFQYWKAKKMTTEGGKMLFYQTRRSSNSHEVFFDDNIKFEDSYIVQPINMSVPAQKQWNVPLLETNLCRAEPLESIYDKNYFIKQLVRLEEGFERKLRAMERLSCSLKQIVTQKSIVSKFLSQPPAETVSETEPEPTKSRRWSAWDGKRRNDKEISQTWEDHKAATSSNDAFL